MQYSIQKPRYNPVNQRSRSERIIVTSTLSPSTYKFDTGPISNEERSREAPSSSGSMYPSSPASLFDILAKKSTRFLIVRLLVVVTAFATSAGAQSSPECSKSSLSDAAIEQLDMYDKDLYLEPACVDGTTPLPFHCNYMGLGQECRGCYMTCDGVEKYLVAFADEYAMWGDDIIHFCPDGEVDSMDECT